MIPFGADLYLRPLRQRGLPYWWLRAAICDACGTHWLVAQEDRLHDVYILRRLDQSEAEALDDRDRWPGDLDRYEALLVIGKAAGHGARFLDRSERPNGRRAPWREAKQTGGLRPASEGPLNMSTFRGVGMRPWIRSS